MRSAMFNMQIFWTIVLLINVVFCQEAQETDQSKDNEHGKTTDEQEMPMLDPEYDRTTTAKPRKEFKGQDVDNFVENLLKCRKNLAAAVVSVLKLNERGEEILSYSKGYGNVDPTCTSTDCEKANENTKFCIGAITKGFTSGVLGKQLLENAKYNKTMWDTPIKDLLPCDQRDFFGGDSLVEKITVRDLLAHRMGLPSGDLVWFLGSDLPRKQLWKTIYNMEMHDSPLAAKWRSSFNYNNWIYTLAGHISELLSNRTWEALVQEYYLDVLKMDATTFVNKADSWKNFAHFGYYKNDEWTSSNEMMNLLRNPDVVAPSGAICSTGSDMLHYLRFLLTNDTNGKNAVPKSIIADTFEPSNYLREKTFAKPTFPVYSGQHTYGMGWFRGVYREYNTLSHSGNMYGFVSHLVLYPDENLGIFVSTTTSMENHPQFAKAIATYASDLSLGEDPWIDNQNACTIYPEIWMSSENLEDKDVESANETMHQLICEGISKEFWQYEGVYQNGISGSMIINAGKGSEKHDGTIRFDIGKSGRGKLCKLDPPLDDQPEALRFWFEGVMSVLNDATLSRRLNATVTFHWDPRPGKLPTAVVGLMGKSVYNWMNEIPIITTPASMLIPLPQVDESTKSGKNGAAANKMHLAGILLYVLLRCKLL